MHVDQFRRRRAKLPWEQQNCFFFYVFLFPYPCDTNNVTKTSLEIIQSNALSPNELVWTSLPILIFEYSWGKMSLKPI